MKDLKKRLEELNKSLDKWKDDDIAKMGAKPLKIPGMPKIFRDLDRDKGKEIDAGIRTMFGKNKRKRKRDLIPNISKL